MGVSVYSPEGCNQRIEALSERHGTHTPRHNKPLKKRNINKYIQKKWHKKTFSRKS